MPHLQGLWEKYKDHPDVIILGVGLSQFSTAEHKKYLASKGYEGPAVQDTNKYFRKSFPLKDRKSGRRYFATPMSMVIDSEGYIVAHDTDSGDQSTNDLMDAFDIAFNDIAIAVPRKKSGAIDDGCLEIVEFIKTAQYTKAYLAAEEMIAATSSSKAEKRDATFLLDVMDRWLNNRIKAFNKQFKEDPVQAITRGKIIMPRYKGIPTADTFIAQLDSWASNDAVKLYLEHEKTYQKIINDIDEKYFGLSLADAKKYRKTLKLIAKDCAAINLGKLAKQESQLLLRAIKAGGYLGCDYDSGYRAEIGAKIKTVWDETPASRAGLKAGDIILETTDAEIAEYKHLIFELKSTKPGTETELLINRGGKKITITVTLGFTPYDRP